MAWFAKPYDGYSRDSPEAIANANEIRNIFSNYGFAINAISAIAGAFQAECDMNPWQWEGNSIQNSGSISPNVGYGLPQFTPATSYIGDSHAVSLTGYAPNFSDISGSATDGEAQSTFIASYHLSADWYTMNYSRWNSVFSSLTPPININTAYYDIDTVNDFKRGTYAGTTTNFSVQDMEIAFIIKYLRPADSSVINRFYSAYLDNANYWYQYYTGTPPTPPTPPTPGTRRKMPLWMMLRHQI